MLRVHPQELIVFLVLTWPVFSQLFFLLPSAKVPNIIRVANNANVRKKEQFLDLFSINELVNFKLQSFKLITYHSMLYFLQEVEGMALPYKKEAAPWLVSTCNLDKVT